VGEISTTTIDGLELELPKLAPWEGAYAFGTFVKLAGPVLPAIMGAVLKETDPDKRKSLVTSSLLGAGPQLLEKLDVRQVLDLGKVLLAECRVRPKAGAEQVKLLTVFDVVVGSRFVLVYRLIWWAASVQFGFSDGGALSAELASLVGNKAQSSTPQTSEKSSPTSGPVTG
jgi:hypothetical protein